MFSIEFVQASKRLSFAGKPRRLTGQHFEAFEDASSDSGRLLVKPTGESAQQRLGLIISIVELPSLPKTPGPPLDTLPAL